MKIRTFDSESYISQQALIALLGISLLVLSGLQHYLNIKSLNEKVNTETEIIGKNLSAAVFFNNAAETDRIVSRLKPESSIRAICVYNQEGVLITDSHFRKIPMQCEHLKSSLLFKLSETPIEYKGNRFGQLKVLYSTKAIWVQSFLFLIMATIIYLILGLIFYSKKSLLQLQLKSYENSLHKLIARNTQLTETSNKKVAIEIHDQIGQLISTALYQLDMIDKKSLNENDKHLIERVKLLLDETYSSIKNISKELHPVILKFGIRVALEWLAETKFSNTNHDWDVKVRLNESLVSEELSVTLFRIAQEGFTNILKHANASKVSLTLFRKKGDIVMEIIDNGVGVNKNLKFTNSLGLIGIAERLKSFNGTASLNSSPISNQTKLEVLIPCKPQ